VAQARRRRRPTSPRYAPPGPCAAAACGAHTLTPPPVPRPQIREYALANPDELWVKKIKPAAFCAIWNFSSPDLMQKCNKSNCCYLPCIAIKARANCASSV